MNDPFFGIRLKMQRAQDQLQNLNAEMKAFRESQPYEIVVEVNPEALEIYGVFKERKVMPSMWSIQIGEIVHNVRSALDHLVWQLVILEAGAPSKAKKLQFPIFDTLVGYQTRGKKMLPGIGTKAKAFIKALQPFATGEGHNSPLWHLKELSDFDKHRSIAVAAATASKISMEAVFGETESVMVSPQRGALKHDTILGGVRLKPSAAPFMERTANAKMEGDFTYCIAFEHPEVAAGKPLISVLAACGGRVGGIMAEARKELFV